MREVSCGDNFFYDGGLEASLILSFLINLVFMYQVFDLLL